MPFWGGQADLEALADWLQQGGVTPGAMESTGVYWIPLFRFKARLGTPQAVVATAPNLAPLVSRLLKHGEAYVAQGMEAYEQANRERVVKI